MKTTLLIMAAGIGSRFGGGIKQLEPVGPSGEIIMEDTVVNDGFADEEIALCYHCNFGYPLVTEGAKILNVPEDVCDIVAPIPGKTEECIPVEYKDSEYVTVGIENDTMTALLTYKTDTMPASR